MATTARTLNLGIVAHVDAGKTTLTERLLFEQGAIDVIGKVDEGSTQTDSLELERKRGITIKTAVASFVTDDLTVNLIDTPGHPDFIAEVERALGVLDGALLVVSGVEGIQPQTRILARALRRLGTPTLVFVNKLDRRSADYEHVLVQLSEELDWSVVSMGTVEGIGGPTVSFLPLELRDRGSSMRLTEFLANHSDDFMKLYVEGSAGLSTEGLQAELVRQTAEAVVSPVFGGSAMTGAGIERLVSGIANLLPAVDGDIDGPFSGTVFKLSEMETAIALPLSASTLAR